MQCPRHVKLRVPRQLGTRCSKHVSAANENVNYTNFSFSIIDSEKTKEVTIPDQDVLIRGMRHRYSYEFSFCWVATLRDVARPPGFLCVNLHAQNATSNSACERLAQLKVPNASVTLAQTTPAGSYFGPADVFTGRDLSSLYKSLLHSAAYK